MSSVLTTSGVEEDPAVRRPDDLELATRRLVRRTKWLRRRDLLLAVTTPLLLLLAWQFLCDADVIDRRIVPAPVEVLAAGWDMLGSGELVDQLVASTGRLMSGYLVGAAGGVLCGIAMGAFRPLNAALGPLFLALYAIPKIAILPLLLLIFGLTETPKILSVVVTVFFILQINALAGVRQIDAKAREAGRAYGAVGWRELRYLTLPAIMPSIFTGLRVATGMAVVVVTGVEFVASNTGLGFLIWNSWQLFQPEKMYVGILAVSLLGVIFTGIVIGIEKLCLPWQRTVTPSAKRKRGVA